METHGAVVFFFDCDNTLLDNDRFKNDLDAYLTRVFGREGAARYWELYDQLRGESGFADYLGSVQRFRIGAESDPRFADLSTYLLDYPFASLLYAGALDVLAHCRAWGNTAILSDGDTVFQPRKLQRSGLWDAVDGRVLIYVHKERSIDEVMQRYPARRYVMIDDKLSILTAMKAILQNRLITVWPRQGHYALDAANDKYPAADLTVDRIADLALVDFSTMLAEQR
jgi:FMN phosphatase YigB (HAD superfamily)